MRTAIAILAAAVLIQTQSTTAAPLQSLFSPGDIVSGTFNLNPAAPPGTSPGDMTLSSPLVNVSTSIAGVVIDPADYDARWLLVSFFNGADIPEIPTLRRFDMRLFGENASPDMRPLGFDMYSAREFHAFVFENLRIVDVVGTLTALAPLDDAGNFSFSGIVTREEVIGAFDPAETPLPSALPLFATGIGLLGYGLRKAFKRRTA
jgi:hypothetical protein